MEKNEENKKINNILGSRIYLNIGIVLMMIGFLLDFWVLFGSFEMPQINEKFFIGIIGLSILFIVLAISFIIAFLIVQTK
jgi:hypothetical protein